ncbi:MAG: hypothetical protein IJJ43_07025 [Oscillospiraceae bacterium]|nr:hypothetical protein [Oscillospiraceae bacterium]
MLSKLLKHEFRATGRVMLPVLGVLLFISVLFNLSVRFYSAGSSVLLNLLFALVVFAFVAGIIAAEIIALVLMITRFYRNLLGEEGYLMHTLPANVHELVWSKIIVSFVWFFVTNLLIILIGVGTALFLSGSNLAEIFADFPGWDEIRAALQEVGLAPRHFIGLGLEYLLLILIGGVAACLHFYAAMALGHTVANHKGLFSVLFFIGISMAFSILSTMVGASSVDALEKLFSNMSTAVQTVHSVQKLFAAVAGWELLQAALLYVATVLGLKKWLNLA